MDDMHSEWRRLLVLELKGDSDAGMLIDSDPRWGAHDNELCIQCGDIFCPWGDELHFHHDGCPSCSQVRDEDWQEFAEVRRAPMLLARNGGG